MGYVVTEASCHDRVAAETVMTQIPHPYNFGDKGFISRDLQKKAVRRIPNGALDSVSKKPETSCVRGMGAVDPTKTQSDRDGDHYRITGIRANSIIGFEVALDGILLAYSLVTLGLVER
jgi:hypothetical protein